MEAAIQQIHDYLAKVDGLLEKTVYIKARAQQYDVVVQQIKAKLPVDCEMAAKLIELVASGPWDADQKENIMLVINGGMSGGTSRALRPRQNCSSFSRFLTSDEPALIKDETKTAAAKLDVLAKRMLLIGLVSPSETTAAQVLATLNLHYSLDGFICGAISACVYAFHKQNRSAIKVLERDICLNGQVSHGCRP